MRPMKVSMAVVASVFASAAIMQGAETAKPSGRRVIIAADESVRSQLTCYSESCVIAVLVSDARTSYAAINQRALRLRHASHYLYDGRSETPMGAMFRERLETYGVVSVNVHDIPTSNGPPFGIRVKGLQPFHQEDESPLVLAHSAEAEKD